MQCWVTAFHELVAGATAAKLLPWQPGPYSIDMGLQDSFLRNWLDKLCSVQQQLRQPPHGPAMVSCGTFQHHHQKVTKARATSDAGVQHQGLPACTAGFGNSGVCCTPNSSDCSIWPCSMSTPSLDNQGRLAAGSSSTSSLSAATSASCLGPSDWSNVALLARERCSLQEYGRVCKALEGTAGLELFR